MKVGTRRARYVWRVIAVDERGHSPGNCGHDHADKISAVLCPWEPVPWPDRCDLLVREVSDRRIDPPRTRRAKP